MADPEQATGDAVFSGGNAVRFAAVVGAVALMAPAAHADNLVADGDGAVAVAANGVAFGTVCASSSGITKTALLAISRNGNVNVNNTTNNNVFMNSTDVTLSVLSNPARVTASLPAAPGNKITLPSAWQAGENNDMSSPVTATVRLDASTVGEVSGSIGLRASGTNTAGGTLNRDTTLPVTANVVRCDTTGPTLSLPANITAEATSASGATVTYTATASDAVDGSRPVTCEPASGSRFTLGTTTVNCSSTDASGNTTRGSFTVTVADTTRPVVGAISDLDATEATSSQGATVTYTSPSATDAVGVTSDPAVSCSPASGSTFKLGTTRVTCSASDAAGNTGTSSFDVTVEDTTRPVLSLPADFTAEADKATGKDVAYTATASDTVDGDRPVSCDPASGSTFALGATTVDCSASDLSDNTATGSFAVTVRDTTAPELESHADEIAEATSGSGAQVTYTAPTATDAVDTTPTVSCLPASGSRFALGSTTVSCEAIDDTGNKSTSSFDVIVRDTTAPALTVPADQLLEATSTAGATADYRPAATDTVDANPAVTCSPASGSTFAIGTTTVSCEATDASGNKATGSFTVKVQRTLKGFHQPVDIARTLNTVKNGATVPLKFEVFAGHTEITSTDIVKPISIRTMNCDSLAAVDEIEATTSGSTTLRYDSTGGQFIYNWQTPRLANTCYLVTVTTTDGAQQNAQFKLR